MEINLCKRQRPFYLGNVLSIITDQKLPQDTNIDLTIDYYTANVIHAQDYYPFGMLMPGRQWENIDSTYQDSVSSVLHFTDFEDPVVITNANGKRSIDGWRAWSGSQVTLVNEEMEVNNTNCTHGAVQVFPVQEDTSYVITFTIPDMGTASQVELHWWQGNQPTSGFTHQGAPILVNSTGTYSVTITPTDPYVQLMFADWVGCGAGNYFVIDDITIETEPYLATLTVGKGYVFGFNGMEMDNEMRGIGNSLDFGARIYDSRFAKFLSVDPMAIMFPNYSPYAGMANNPIFFIDVHGQFPFSFYIRSFHPSATFGGGFGGDDRGFSTDLNATSRIQHQFDIETDFSGNKPALTYKPDYTTSDETKHWALGSKTEDPEGEATLESSSNNTVHSRIVVNTKYAGANPLVTSPDIDVSAKFWINHDKNTNILTIEFRVFGDDFPNTEMFITDNSGQKLFLGVDVRDDGWVVPTILDGDADHKIISGELKVSLDDEGNFTSISINGNEYGIDEWNDLFENQDPDQSDIDRTQDEMNDSNYGSGDDIGL